MHPGTLSPSVFDLFFERGVLPFPPPTQVSRSILAVVKGHESISFLLFFFCPTLVAIAASVLNFWCQLAKNLRPIQGRLLLDGTLLLEAPPFFCPRFFSPSGALTAFRDGPLFLFLLGPVACRSNPFSRHRPKAWKNPCLLIRPGFPYISMGIPAGFLHCWLASSCSSRTLLYSTAFLLNAGPLVCRPCFDIWHPSQ